MNEQPYFCCGQLPSEGHTKICEDRHDWNEVRGAMPVCMCGHAWAVHIIPGGIENIDVYPQQRCCDDCSCKDYKPYDVKSFTE